jgi:hypothetical protein
MMTHQKLDIGSSIRNMLYEELKNKKFIEKELQILLNKPSYYRITYNNLLMNFIPVPKFRLKEGIHLMKRLKYIAKKEQITHPVHIWIVPCNSKRCFPHKYDDLFDEKHINGGYTYCQSHNHDTYIYRLEDVQKTTIHELLHNSKIDIKMIDAAPLLNEYKISPHSPQPLLINEASIEAWTMYYHLKCIAYEKKESFKNLMKKELDYSLSLSHKLTLYHNGLWTEYTNAYAYIRLKTCILFHWSEFLKSTDLVSFLKTYNNHPTFLKAIYKTKIPESNSCKITLYGSH